ncbi:MAG TPA: lipid A deacylase LpxR family protein [Bacteroidales bacterium]|nr:lipid A deacylase LpxR family protein [Bacteroidales bacterium]
MRVESSMMFRNYSFFPLCFFVFFSFIACNKEVKDKTSSSELVLYDSAIVFYYPDGKFEDSLKNALGLEEFHHLRDSLTQFNFIWRKWADSLRLKQIVTDARLIEFKIGNGIAYTIKLTKLCQPWGIILFYKNLYPEFITHPPTFPPAVHTSETQTLKQQSKKSAISRTSIQNDDHLSSSKKPADSLPFLKRLSAHIIQVFTPPKEFTYEGPSASAAFHGKVLPQKVVSAFVDNDVFLGTDLWYTHGANITWINPAWQSNPLTFLLHPVIGKSYDYYGLLIRQNFYTPVYNTYEEIQYNDRPFASYLYLGQFKVSNFPSFRMKFSTEFDIGMLGPSSLGQEVQTFVHNSNKKPIGWKHQIHDDIVLQYQAEIEKSLFFVPGHDITLESRLQAGTLYDKLSAGFAYRFARFDRRYTNDLPQRNKSVIWKDFFAGAQIEFFTKVEATTVFYDATLQGGMFNHSSPYTLREKDVERYLMMTSSGITTMFKGISLGANVYLLSPEFAQQKRWHKWGRIILSIAY